MLCEKVKLVQIFFYIWIAKLCSLCQLEFNLTTTTSNYDLDNTQTGLNLFNTSWEYRYLIDKISPYFIFVLNFAAGQLQIQQVSFWYIMLESNTEADTLQKKTKYESSIGHYMHLTT